MRVPRRPTHFLFLAVTVEGGMAVGAALLNVLLRRPPFSDLHPALLPALIGALAALPLLFLFEAVLSRPWPPFTRIQNVLDAALWPLVRRSGPLELLFVSALAGLGEELLFRGVVQGWLSQKIGVTGALAAASLLFGIAHPLTKTYLVAATLIGAYLGGLWLWTGNLLAPITCHAMYDFLALLLYQREKRITYS